MCALCFVTFPCQVVPLHPELHAVTSIPPTSPRINCLRHFSIVALPRRPHSDHWPTKDIPVLRSQEQDSRICMLLRRNPTSFLQMAVLGSYYRNDRVLEF